MKSRDLYFIRHGETNYNRTGRIQGGGVDVPLNCSGIAQSLQFFFRYGRVPFQVIYSSPLTRAQQTVVPFADLGIPVRTMDELREIDWGSMEGKIPDDKADDCYHQTLKHWNGGRLDVNVCGGESAQQVYERQAPAATKILSAKGEGPVLICLHGRALRIFLAGHIRRDLSIMDRFPHSNLCLYRVRISDSGADILQFNDVEHLKDFNLPIAAS